MKRRHPPNPPEKPAVKLSEGSVKARQSAARLAAAQALYQMFMSGQSARVVLKEFSDHRIGYEIDGDVLVPADYELLEKIVCGVESRVEDVLGLIKGARGEDLARMDQLLRAILMAGAYELLAHKDIGSKIIMNDYINVAHAFYEESDAKLVNAVLDKISRAVV